MRRREFIIALGGAAVAWPRTLFAQSADRAYVIGWLSGGDPNDPLAQTFRVAFTKELNHLGWVEGRNLRIERRWAGGDSARARALAKELVELRPHLIVAATSLSMGALVRETRTVPIVFVGVSNPVEQGYVTNLVKPGGNITGFANQPELSLATKWVELLKEIVPNVSTIALMFNPETTRGAASMDAAREAMFAAIETAATSFGIEASRMPVDKIDRIEASIVELARKPRSGMIVMPDPWLFFHRDPVIRASSEHRLPALYPFGLLAREGGLISYGNDLVEPIRLSASYVDRILRGEKPGDLPIQQPTKFKFVINLKTAKVIGLTISPSLLARADEVIE